MKEFHVLKVSWSLFVVKAISLLNQIEGLTVIRIVQLEQLEQIAIVKVFLKCFFTTRVFFFGNTFINFNCLKIHTFLVNLSSINFLFQPTNTDQSINNNIFFLADSVAPIDCLVIIGWIPIWINNNGSIRPR